MPMTSSNIHAAKLAGNAPVGLGWSPVAVSVPVLAAVQPEPAHVSCLAQAPGHRELRARHHGILAAAE